MNQIQPNLFGEYSTPHPERVLPVLLLAALIGLACYFIIIPAYRRYTGFTYGQAVKLWACALGLTFAGLVFISIQPAHGRMEPFIKYTIFTFLLSFLALPFVVQLYCKWIGGHLTDAEKLPGMDGVRTWLGKGNVICAVLIPICAWQAFDTSLLTVFVLTFGALLAYPVLNLVSTTPQTAPAIPTADLTAEREKVLQLLEAGKITADESAELLNALGQSVPQRPPPTSEMEMSPARKMVLLGAALLLAGFFLPWFAINPGVMVNEMTAQMQHNLNQAMPGNGMPRMNFPNATITGTVQVHAGDLAHGLGWWILALGIGAAGLPFFATTLKADLQKKAILAALAVGAFLMVYLLSDALRYVGVGVILALAGYALEFVGTLKERPVFR